MASKEALAHLGQHPAWGQLRQLAAERQEAETKRLAAAIMRGDEIPQVDIAYHRGFFKGMQYLLANPALEAKKLRAELGVEESDPI